MFKREWIESLLADQDAEIPEKDLFSNAVIDSRKAGKDDLFFAFEGERCDGHSFIRDLIEKEIYCVGEKDLVQSRFYIKVSNVLDFLSKCAAQVRRKRGLRIYAITGSSGKTSTRELVVKLLAGEERKVCGTKGNLNNHIGLPLTLLNLDESCTEAVIELGMNHSGEIRALADIAKPDLALITNIGFAHIGNFNNQQELADAKLEIFEQSDTLPVIHIDDPFCAEWQKHNSNRKIVSYSLSGKSADIQFKDDHGLITVVHNVKNIDEIDLSDWQPFMRENAMSAIALSIASGVSNINHDAFHNFSIPSYRGEEISAGSRFFTMDCYNANPVSMKKAVDAFIQKANQKKWNDVYLVLGEMGELGRFSQKFHRELVNYVKLFRVVKQVFLVGNEFDKIRDEFIDCKKIVHFRDLTLLADQLPEAGYFLLKGSRSNRLEKLVSLVGG